MNTARFRRPALLLPLLLLAACGDAGDKQAEPTATPDPAGAVTAPEAGPSAADTNAAVESFEKSMPRALYGRWHKDDLGHAPTVADCDPYRDGTRDYDRLITVRGGGYSYFETGGRITEVHTRTDRMIDATFDTTYADTPTSARKTFRLGADNILLVQSDGTETASTETTYRHCPE